MNSGIENDVAAIIFWVNLGVLVLGVILTVLFGILFAVARSKPVAPSPPGYPPASKGGGCLLVAAILSFVFLVLFPGIGMVASAVIEAARPPARVYDTPRTSTSSNTSSTAASRLESDADRAVREANGAANNAELELRIAEIGATMRSNLPQRNGPATLYNVQAAGAELIMFVNLSQDFGGTEWRAFDQGIQSETCSGQFAGVVRDGGSITYRVQDSGGEPHTVSVTSCR